MDPDVRKSSWPPLVTPTTLRSVQAPSRYLFPHNAGKRGWGGCWRLGCFASMKVIFQPLFFLLRS